MTGVPPGSGGPDSRRLPRRRRIKRSADIRRLLRRGTRARSRNLDVFFGPSPLDDSRFGVIVPKHRHTIVERNRLKRRLREIGRSDVLPRLRASGLRLDVVVRARASAYRSGFQAMRSELLNWMESTCSAA